jgi:hypothetical protein
LRSRGVQKTSDFANLSMDDVDKIVPAPKSIHKKKLTELLNAAQTYTATQVGVCVFLFLCEFFYFTDIYILVTS